MSPEKLKAGNEASKTATSTLNFNPAQCLAHSKAAKLHRNVVSLPFVVPILQTIITAPLFYPMHHSINTSNLAK